MSKCLIRLLLILAAVSLAVTVTAQPAPAAGFVVIANRDVPADSLSRSDLQTVFLGEKVKWDRGHYIKVVMPEDADLVKDFLRDVVGKTPSQFDNHWAKLTFTGRAVPPKVFPETSRLVEYVAGHRGAISFVPAGQAGTTVKTISIR